MYGGSGDVGWVVGGYFLFAEKLWRGYCYNTMVLFLLMVLVDVIAGAIVIVIGVVDDLWNGNVMFCLNEGRIHIDQGWRI